jgi:hypothetical protein
MSRIPFSKRGEKISPRRENSLVGIIYPIFVSDIRNNEMAIVKSVNKTVHSPEEMISLIPKGGWGGTHYSNIYVFFSTE